MAVKCTECKRELNVGEARFMYGNRLVCDTCIDELSGQGNICPNCGAALPPDHEEIAIVLPLVRDSKAFRAIIGGKVMEPETLLLICPKCHVLFMDKFQYKIMQGLVRDLTPKKS